MNRIITRLKVFASVLVAATLLAACQKDDPVENKNVYRISYGIPTISIATDANEPVLSKTESKLCTVKYYEDGEADPSVVATGKIHTRGNATATYPKKPYKIKFDEKQSLGGFPENRDWVLLALYCDHSLIRECYMHEMAKVLDLPYQMRHRYVWVSLNGEQLGVYLLIEQVEEAAERINVDENGFILEQGNYLTQETLYFYTDKKKHGFSFRYPDPDKENIVTGDAEYNYITSFMNNFENALYGSNFKDPTNGYRKYINPESWAKWYLVHEIIGNMDTNNYFVLLRHGDKLDRGPVWDAEWSFGLAASGSHGWATVSEGIKPIVEGSYRKNSTFYNVLFQDPYFVGLVKKEWENLKVQMPQVRKDMDDLAKSIKVAQARNFTIWPILGSYTSVGLVALGDWQKEVDYVNNFLEEHSAWFDEWIYQQ